MEKKEIVFDELEDLLSTSGMIKRELQEKICFEGTGCLKLLVINAEKASQAAIELARILGQEKIAGIFASGSIPAEALKEKLTKAKISTKNVAFVDFATRTTTNQKEEKIFFAGSPKEITSLEIAIDRAFNEIHDKKAAFLVFDSISILLAYHDKSVVERFVHVIAAKIRKRGKMNAIIMAMKGKTDSEFFGRIAEYFDGTIFIK